MLNSQMAADRIVLSDLDQYRCGTGDDEDKPDRQPKSDRMVRLREAFENHGSVRSVRAVILVLIHRHPHMFLLEKSDDSGRFVIPGGKLRPGEDDETGLQRLLGVKMQLIEGDYEVVDQLLATWYRPQFTDQLFPYLPVHVSSPKEIEHWYLVLLPEKGNLRINSKYKRLSVASFYDLQEGKKYGKQLSLVPLLVSRFNIVPRQA
jgi:cleavage and polyadenylation specificity factor subunit 5